MRSHRQQTLTAYKFSYASRTTFSSVSNASLQLAENKCISTIYFSDFERFMEVFDPTEYNVLETLTLNQFYFK